MHYPFQSTGRPISHRNVWSFRVYMIPLWDFVPEWNSRPGTTTGVNSRRGDSRRHDILWWYHVNKCRAMRGNRSELTPARKSPWCHVNSPRKYFMKESVSIMKKVLDLYSCCLCSTKRHLNNKEEKIPKAYRENQNQWRLSNFFFPSNTETWIHPPNIFKLHNEVPRLPITLWLTRLCSKEIRESPVLWTCKI